MGAARDIAEAYLAALAAGDLDGLLSLFAADATVVSPVYGTRQAPDFFTDLLADTRASSVTLRDVFSSADDPTKLAFAFRYDWDLATGGRVSFLVVDIMTLDAAGRIARLEIVYDASEAKALLAP